ncbi:MAG: N-acetylmuramic acid 6-phosphate etherase [Saprospiraceae bacterium]
MSEHSTEATSSYQELEKMDTHMILNCINSEDIKVALAVKNSLTQIEKLIEALLLKIQNGGRLFYIGAGSSGRLGILDASECPPTYGVSEELVIGIIAGGDRAIRHAIENAEDDPDAGFGQLKAKMVSKQDFVVGIAASGKTPYVVGAIQQCKNAGISTACIVCNTASPLAKIADYPVEIIVGPEFVSGSTRMKAGSAQKMVLNMISTALMIKLGKVKGNKMVDMKVSNAKLKKRAIDMVCEETKLSKEEAAELIHRYGSVRKAMEAWELNK